MKVLCVLLPHFQLGCETSRDPAMSARQVVIIHGAGSKKLVLDFSPKMSDLRPGMSLQQALARYDKADLVQADLPFYRSVFTRILDGLEEKSPMVEGPEPGVAYMCIDGLQFIYPDEAVLVEGVLKGLPEPFVPQIGIARGKFPAYLAALYSHPGGCRILPADPSAFLSPLSCDVLPLSPKAAGKLRDFGIKTLGQLASFPEGPLQAQFGLEGRQLQELARGIDPVPVYPRLWEEVIENSAVLPSVTVSMDTVLVVMESLLAPVFNRISPAGLGVTGMDVWTRSWNAENWSHSIQFKEPAMDSHAVVSRIRHVMENFPQPGPVEEAGVRITRLGYPTGRQKSLFREVRGRDNLMEDIRRLELRQGDTLVFRIKEVEPWSRIPERRYVLTPTGR